MPNWYAHRDHLKDALGIPTSTTGGHLQLDQTLEAVSRLFDDYVGFHLFPSSGTRYFTPAKTTALDLDAPLLAIDAIQTSSNGGSTYGTTLSSNDYYALPYNATEESPRRPWWRLEIANNATAVFSNFPRGTRILGRWGYYDQTILSTAVLSTAANATATVLEVTGATSLHPGQTLLIGTEQLFVVLSPTSASATHSSQITVRRAQNGTTGATHSSATGINIYEYPIVDRAALYQAEQDYRAKDAPMGFAGDQGFGTQRMSAPGGLHPFTRRMLDGFRTPVVR